MNSVINDIQAGYFEIIKKYFGHFYNESKRAGVSSGEIAKSILSQPKIKKLLEANIYDTLGVELRSYWELNFKKLTEEISKLNGLVMYYSGDISPADTSIVNRMGLYADTIILPDPGTRILSNLISDITKPKYGLYLLLKHVIRVLEYEDAVFAKTCQPIIIFYPSQLIFENEEVAKKMHPITCQQTTNFLNDNLTLQKDNYEEWVNYFKSINEIGDLKKILRNKSAFLFDSNIDLNNFNEQIDGLIKYSKKYIKEQVNEAYGGGLAIIPYSILGRMGQSYWHIIKADMLDASPIQDASVSWHYLKWQMQHNKKTSSSSIISSCLQEEKFNFLSNVPLHVLIKMREEGELQDLRDTINKEICVDISKDNTETIIKQITYNLSTEFRKHQSKIKKIDEDYRRIFKMDAITLLSAVGLSIVGSVGNSWHNLAGTILGATMGGKGIVDFTKKYDELRQAKHKFNNSLWGFYAKNIKK